MKWALVYVLEWAVLYAAFVLKLDGAMYVLKFAVWSILVLSPAFMMDATIQKAAESAKRYGPIQVGLGRLLSWTALLALVWFGHFATAVAWLIVMIMVAGHNGAVAKLRAEGSKP